MSSVTVSSKGQIVLPREVRQELGICQGNRLEMRTRGWEVVLRLVSDAKRSAAPDWRAWRGSLKGTASLDELITEHREEVRRERLP